MKQVPGYTLVRTEDCPEQHGTLTVLTHDVSGATILLVENEDNNKAFGIGFGTFPSDDTGVFHILEHSVLAGSEKYPVTTPLTVPSASRCQPSCSNTALSTMASGQNTAFR